MSKIQKLFLLIALPLMFGCDNSVDSQPQTETDYLFQYSSKERFLAKEYDSEYSIKQLLKNGDTGLGTFNGVDGEMIVENGIVYQVKGTGEVVISPMSSYTPLAIVKNFNADTTFSISSKLSREQIENILTPILKKHNNVAAIRIDGLFESIKSRSVFKSEKPYPTLSEIVEEQQVFNFEKIDGSIIGFWYPLHFDGVNFPGYHFHFLSKARNGGGHLLDCTSSNVTVKIDYSEGVIAKAP